MWMRRFAAWYQQGGIPEEYRELNEYFKIHYKNSNKGVKGRGKSRVVARRENWSPQPAEQVFEADTTSFGAYTPSFGGYTPSCSTDSSSWGSDSSDFDSFTSLSPLSVGDQIFPEQDYDTPMSVDSPFY